MACRRLTLGIVLGLAMAQGAAAVPQLLTFEGLGDVEFINNYYDGGLGSLGSGPGPDLDITFGPDALSVIDIDAGGNGNFANEPSADTIAFFLSGPGVVMNVLNGFTTGFSFFYSSSVPAFVTVYDGLNGTGSVLATLSLNAQGGFSEGCQAPGDPSGYFACWDPAGALFSGTAYSVSFGGATNQTGFDNITLESSIPLPEPGTALLVTAGLLGLAMQRKRLA